MTSHFYSELKSISSLSDLTNPLSFKPMPDEWSIVITDIKGSTIAIKEGKYKEVNMIAACSIICVLNSIKDVDIPYVFGGDGCTLLIPNEYIKQIIDPLIATKKLAKYEFNLDLRIGIVPIEDITKTEYKINIAKYEISPEYSQAMFIGGGLGYAEKLIKSNDSKYLLGENIDLSASKQQADYTGLECRWKDIPSRHGEIVSLIIQANEKSYQSIKIYKKVIEQIGKIYGNNEARKPVISADLNIALSNKTLQFESRVKQSGSIIKKNLFAAGLKFKNLVGIILIKFNITTSGVNWGKYKNLVTTTTDSEKIDDMLRMIISGTEIQSQKLENFLTELENQKELKYGIHVSDKAHMTCLVFNRSGKQVHFVDGGDGGYAMAAQIMKAKL